MEQFNINTTQNVVIQYTPASIGERLLARLLDLVIFGVYLFLAFMILFKVIDSEYDLGDIPIISTLICLPVIFYTIWIESLLNGRSFGKIIMGLKVVKTSGKPAGVGDFAIRWLLRMVEGEVALFTGLQIPVALISGKGQRLGDMLAGTALIRTRQQTQIQNT
ncbi:MAG: RDD family protein, partial [Bacteroidia bacterium]